MDRQTNAWMPNQSLSKIKEPILVKEEYIQSNKSQKLCEKIEDQEQFLYEEETKPEQKAEQQEEYQPLEGYIISKTLGKGNFGKVKLAMHKLTQQYVAVKILQKELIFQNTDIVRITRELKIMKKLRHPFVVQLYEIIETPKQLYLIMEYAQGGDLFQKIVNQERIKQAQAARIYTQIALGMDYFHSKGVTHRDLKPQNILLSKDGTIKIADFGLGNMFKPEEKLKTACGSPCYASPQMLSREPYDPEKIDIWSSGIILYAMVCGYLPFEDNITAKLYEKIKTASVKLPSWVSSPCRNLIRGLMTKDPKQRFDIQTILAHEMIAPYAEELREIIRERQLTENKIDEICEMYDVDQKQKLVSDLNKNRHNNLTTLYYLGIKRLGKMEKEPKKFDKKNNKQSQDISQEKMEQNEHKEDLLSSFSSKGEDEKVVSMKEYENVQNEQKGEQQIFQRNSTKIDEQKIEERSWKVKTPMVEAANESQMVEEIQQKDIMIEKYLQQNVSRSMSFQTKQKPNVYEQKIEQHPMQNEQNESIAQENKMQEQDQKILSDDELQIHKLHQELTFSPKDIESTEIHHYQQKEEIATQQAKIVQEVKLSDQGSVELQNIHTHKNENSIIQESYQLSLQIQQTLQQLNEINRLSQQMSIEKSESGQNDDVHVHEFHSIPPDQQTNIQQSVQISNLEKENQPQNTMEINALQSLESHQQLHLNEMQCQENRKSQKDQHIQQTIVLQSLSTMSENKQKIIEQPLFELLDQKKHMVSHKLQEFQNQNQTQRNEIETEQHIITPQIQVLNAIQKDFQQQNKLEIQQFGEKLPQKNHLSHDHANFDRQSALQLQQYQSIETFIPKNDEITPKNNIEVSDNFFQNSHESKLIRQNNKKNHLFSTEKVLSQKQQHLKPLNDLQKEKDHIKKSQIIQKEAKNEIKNILSARNIRLNERSHSKESPIVFKSNKNTMALKPQLQKQQKKQKSLSKQKKSNVPSKLSDSKTKDNQKQQKILVKNEKKAAVREKFVIAKDIKTQKRQTLPIKDQNKNKSVAEKTKQEKDGKARNSLKEDDKKLKPLPIAHIKQSPVKMINKVESKNHLKTSSSIAENLKKITNNDIKMKESVDEGKYQNVPISPISGVKNKDASATFKPIKLGFEDQLKTQLQYGTKQQADIKFSPASQSSQPQKERKKVKISKPNLSYVYNPGKLKSFSQYSNLNSTVSPGSYSKTQISKVNQQTKNNKEKFNKTLGSFSYGNKESTEKQQITSLKEFQKPEKIHNFGVQSSKNFLKESGLRIKETQHEDQQNFAITFSLAQPELINPELILFVSVSELYHLVQSISLLKNINFAHIAGSLTVFEYPSKDYMYVLSSNLHKFSQIQSNMKKSPTKSSPTKKKSKISAFEFVELINSIVLKN